MTKTLTEQWCDGTLENGFYYVRSGWSKFVETRYLGKGFFEGNIEVIAPVPTYEEWQAELASNDELLTVQKRLERRLEIATKALKEMVGEPPTTFSDCETYMWAALQALKEMEKIE